MTIDGKHYIKAKLDLFGEGEISAYGVGDGSSSGGSSLIEWGIEHNKFVSLKAAGQEKDMALKGHKHSTNEITGIDNYATKDFVTDEIASTAPKSHKHPMSDVNDLIDTLAGKENVFSKNTAFNKAFGSGYDDVARGNHTHNISEIEGKDVWIAGKEYAKESDVQSLQTDLN